MDKIRIGAVDYLNTRPLVFGLEQGTPSDDVELTYAVPSLLADRMLDGELDVALLPVIELARMPELELVPGLGIVTFGASRSVLLVSRCPLDEVRSVALDAESRTSNALVQLLFDGPWSARPRFVDGPRRLDDALACCDAAVRIGDKALFEPRPGDAEVYDLARVWTDTTGLPFVFAAWFARPGVVDAALYRRLHDSRRKGSSCLERIAEEYSWNGVRDPELALAYLRENIQYRLGAAEVDSMRRFFDSARSLGLIEASPPIRLALRKWTACHEAAAWVTPTRG